MNIKKNFNPQNWCTIIYRNVTYDVYKKILLQKYSVIDFYIIIKYPSKSIAQLDKRGKGGQKR